MQYTAKTSPPVNCPAGGPVKPPQNKAANKAVHIATQLSHLRASVLDVPARAKRLLAEGYTFRRIDGETGAFDVVKPGKPGAPENKPAYKVRLFRATTGNAKNGWGYQCNCRFFWAMNWASCIDKSLVPQCKHGHFVLARFLKQLAGVEHVLGGDLPARRAGFTSCSAGGSALLASRRKGTGR